MSKNVGSISHGQAHEAAKQIERGLKDLNLDPSIAVGPLINMNFFQEVAKNHHLFSQFFTRYNPKIYEKKLSTKLREQMEEKSLCGDAPFSLVVDNPDIRKKFLEMRELAGFAYILNELLVKKHAEQAACIKEVQNKCEHPNIKDHLSLHDNEYIDEAVPYRSCPDCGCLINRPSVYLPSANMCGICWGPVTLLEKDPGPVCLNRIHTYKCNDTNCGHIQKSNYLQ